MSEYATQITFPSWKKDFLNRTVAIYSDCDPTPKRIPITTIIKEISAVCGNASAVSCFEHSILVACYKATYSQADGKDAIAIERNDWQASYDSIQDNIESIETVQKILQKNENFMTTAFSHSEPRHKSATVIKDEARDKFGTLSMLLQELNIGLNALQDFDHPENMNVFRDYVHGPLVLETRITVDKQKGEITKRLIDARKAGLVFHLTYLFRYVSSGPYPLSTKMMTDQGCIVVTGPMISGGKPYSQFVAALVNATLGTRMTPKDVRQTITDLHRSKIVEHDQTLGKTVVKHKKRSPQFIGWDTQLR